MTPPRMLAVAMIAPAAIALVVSVCLVSFTKGASPDHNYVQLAGFVLLFAGIALWKRGAKPKR